ncbi:Uncharacterized protein pbN1_41780 [Aromatoleum bremense]|uniref:hypothetical protein n=1 Tax=Aromatoleum bremense TaxID=76115 RepID=UPI001AEC06C5|nr:hypothetical protein [Aromatoleum bremense]QTQ34161.1 Uncharacterized protein pbN1_41780 [Aromatoleum bremense]
MGQRFNKLSEKHIQFITEPLAKVRLRKCESEAFARRERDFRIGGVGRAFRLGHWHGFAIF